MFNGELKGTRVLYSAHAQVDVLYLAIGSKMSDQPWKTEPEEEDEDLEIEDAVSNQYHCMSSNSPA